MSTEDIDGNGPLVTQAYVCKAAGEPFVLEDITLPPLKATQVELDMQYCGLCHTDMHMRDNDWGISNYPLVAGHEGIGKVRKVAAGVTMLQVGDTVGVTWIRDSCKKCEMCMCGRENLCDEGYQGTFLGSNAGSWGKEPMSEHGGCFSKVMRLEERFAIKIPEGLPATVACPLLCGGGTVYESVVDYVKPGMKVAVSSIGGLGTAAIKFCKLYGGIVTALSHSEEKREKCIAVGAKDFYACLGKPDEMAKLANHFDLIIDTSPVNADVGPFMNMLKFNGTYCRVGIPDAKHMSFQFDYIPLIFTERKIAGSVVTGTLRMKKMMDLTKDNLDFIGHDPDSWKSQIVPYDKINDIMEDLKHGRNTDNYRYVFEW